MAETSSGNPSAANLPPLSRAALLLDLDGTLVDIAPRPELVVVPAGLADALYLLRLRLKGALAIVSGRPIEQIDGLLPGVPQAIGGEHGAAIRTAPGAEIERPVLPHAPTAWRQAAARIAEANPGTRLEDKEHGFVLHYRAVPEAGAILYAEIALVVAQDAAFAIMPARMAWEVKPRGADKGTALRAIMSVAPFRSRVPIFIGDDVTDEDGIAAARELGGVGLRVPECFGDATGVRAWLATAAARGEKEDEWPVW